MVDRKDKTIGVWRVEDGSAVCTIDVREQWPNGVVFLGGDDRLALCSSDKTIRIWDLQSGRMIQSLPQPDSIRCVAYEPTKKLLAWGRYDGIVTVWDTQKSEKGVGCIVRQVCRWFRCIQSGRNPNRGSRIRSRSRARREDCVVGRRDRPTPSDV